MSKTKKKKSRGKKALQILLSALLTLVLVGGAGYLVLHYYYGKLNIIPIEDLTGRGDPPESRATEPEPTGDPALALSADEYDSLKALLDANVKTGEFILSDENIWNVLLIGTDNLKDEEVGRSDSMILVSVSKYTNTIVLTSLMRDMYLKIPGYGYNRINAALPTGGVPLLVDTIESNFGLNIDNYAMVDFEVFQQIIDALGGVYLIPNEEEVDYLNTIFEQLGRDDCLLDYTDEPVLFNGFQTLYYARIRYIGNSDFDRTERQRKILLSAKERVLNMDLTELLDLIGQFLPDVTTDVSKEKCISLLFSAYNMLKNYEIQQLRFPSDETMDSATIDGMEVLLVDSPDDNVELWMELVYDDNS